jgi:arginine N-succinyltransferase
VFLIRASSPADVEQILAVATHLDTVNLPASRQHLERILEHSENSFSGALPPFEREYLFVLEDLEHRRIVGTSMIHAQHGTRRAPHVFFQVLKEERYSETLDRYFVHECLRIGYNYDGPTEIGGLILLPEFRGHPQSLGKLLSYTRFLFIAMHRQLFRDQVLSELLPPLEPDGTSLLWEHLGRKFTGLTYQEADLLSKDNKEFIRTLFPHELIYTSLLPLELRQIIGQVGPETKGVEKMLRRIGFQYAHQIDPFDGGPHFLARTDEITLVRTSQQVEARAIDHADADRPWAVIAVEEPGSPAHFRATSARVIPELAAKPDGGVVGVPSTALAALGVQAGDRVWMVSG